MTHLKFLLLLLNAVCLLGMPGTGAASHAAIVIDADNGAVLHEVNATHAWYPASLTKLMTLYMTFDAIKSGQVQLDDTMTASSRAARQPNSKLGLRTGEHITVKDAVLALITRSANDASVVLAEHLGGTEDNFAGQMTDKAHSLGMYNSHFMNATGLPNDLQVTTPRDMAVLAWKTLHNFPEHYHYFSAHSLNFRGSELRAINKFTANYPGAEGMKTGFTCGSGFNLIGSAQQNGKRLIGVVMGGMTSHERYQLMMQKMDASFARGSGDPGRTIESMPTGGAGIPPYQLDCGNGAASRYVSANYLPTTNSSLQSSHYKHAAPALTRVRHVRASRSRVIHRASLSAKMVHAKAMPVQTKKLKPYKSASSIKPQLVSAHIKPRVIVAKVVSKPLVKSHAVGSAKTPLKVAQKSPR
jgi:D-alanyl-D-alanine carboxypeptidase